MKMRRSLLFIPGNNPAMMQNFDVFECDTVIIDLEDAVSAAEKDSARNLAYYFLEQFENTNQEIMVRINGFDTPFFERDLEQVVSDKIDAIMFPKARVTEVKMLAKRLKEIEIKKQMKKTLTIVPIIELASSVLEIEAIAALERVDGILLGAEDLTTDLEIERTTSGAELAYTRAKIAFACKANQIDAIDAPFTNIADQAGLRSDTLCAQGLGMNAKVAIHPNQIWIINEVLSPSPKRIEWALRVLEANRLALEKGLGVFSLDGKMVDKPVIRQAEKIIAKAKRFNVL